MQKKLRTVTTQTERANFPIRFRSTDPHKQRRQTTRVLVFGTFDLLHPGHRDFLRQAKKLGTQLIVAVGRDRVVQRLKHTKLHQNEKHRLRMVAGVRHVTRAILAPSNPDERFDFIINLKPQIIALGYDQIHYTQDLANNLRTRGLSVRIVRLRPFHPKTYKSSIIRARLAQKKKT